jgi:hypothetical protein
MIEWVVTGAIQMLHTATPLAQPCWSTPARPGLIDGQLQPPDIPCSLVCLDSSPAAASPLPVALAPPSRFAHPNSSSVPVALSLLVTGARGPHRADEGEGGVS